MKSLLNNDKCLFDWEHMQIHLRFCYEGEVPQSGYGQTRAAFNSAWLVRSGWAEVTCNDLPAVRANAGDWVFVPPGERLQQFSADAHIVSIAFNATYLLKEHMFTENLPALLISGQALQLNKTTAALLKRTIQGRLNHRFDAWEEDMDMVAFLKLKTTFVKWLTALVEAFSLLEVHPHFRSEEDEIVAGAVRLISGLANTKELKVSELAHRLGTSVSQLHRRFTRTTGSTLHRFYNQLRLEAACERLRNSNSSLKLIAYEMGFQHPANFSNWFKSQTGKTPKAYRNSFEPKSLPDKDHQR